MGMRCNSVKNKNCGIPWGLENCTEIVGTSTTTGMEAIVSQKVKNGGNLGAILGGVLGGIFLIGLIVGFLIFLKKRKPLQKEDKPVKKRDLTSSIELKSSVNKTITNIKIGERLGGGAFSDVYKGLWNVNKFVFIV